MLNWNVIINVLSRREDWLGPGRKDLVSWCGIERNESSILLCSMKMCGRRVAHSSQDTFKIHAVAHNLLQPCISGVLLF